MINPSPTNLAKSIYDLSPGDQYYWHGMLVEVILGPLIPLRGEKERAAVKLPYLEQAKLMKPATSKTSYPVALVKRMYNNQYQFVGTPTHKSSALSTNDLEIGELVNNMFAELGSTFNHSELSCFNHKQFRTIFKEQGEVSASKFLIDLGVKETEIDKYIQNEKNLSNAFNEVLTHD